MEISGRIMLITGGTGQIGCHIAEQLLEEDVEKIVIFDNLSLNTQPNISEISKDSKVEIVEGDVTKRDDLRRAFRGVDGVFHLASLMTLHSRTNPRSLLDVNINGTYNVLEACQEAGAKKMILSSTHSVYGVPNTDPITEDHPFNHQSMYGATKVAAEQLCQAFRGIYGLDYVILRYATVYGDRQHKRGRNSAFLLDNIERIEDGRRPVIRGDGKRTLNMICVDDVARANILALKSSVASEAFLIADRENVTEESVIRLLLELLDSDLEPEYLPSDEAIERHNFCVEKAEKFLGFKTEISLRDGLIKLLQWYRRCKWT
jgi:UDP-glucose 4-epimerase